MRRLLVLAVTIAPHLAGAAPIPAPSLSAIGPVGVKTPLTVDSASLRIDCKSRDECAFEVRYAISNPTDARLDGTAAFHAMSTHDMKVTVAGAPVDLANDSGTSERQSFAISVGPSATTEVVVTGTLAPSIRRTEDSFAWQAYAETARHMVLAPDVPRIARVELDYVVAPIRRWGAAPKDMPVTLVLPSDWIPRLDGAANMDQSRSPDGRTIHEATVPTTIHTLTIDVYLGALGSWLRGGIFAGIGGNVDDATGIRTRFGGELAWRHRYLASLALEIEWDDPKSFVIVPALAVASEWIVIVPSIGVGVGVPLRVSPSFEVGGRVQLDAHYGPIGYFLAFDWYPNMDAAPRRFEVAMMAVLSI